MSEQLIASSENRVVVGLGATGVSCARFFYTTGARFSVVDTRVNPPGVEAFRAEFPDVPLYLGEVPEGLLEEATEVIVSPGVAMDAPLVQLAQAAGVSVVGDIDIFRREAKAPVVGITGSNAKSTVTELLGQMARDAGVAVAVGGNLGTPALELLGDDVALYVLELSSFQLERAGELTLAVATVLNVSADHLDRHHNMTQYHRAKHQVFRGCNKAVVNADDPLTRPLLPEAVEVVTWSGSEPALKGFGLRCIDGREFLCKGFQALLAVDELQLAGRHNVANVLAAMALGYAVGLPLSAMCASARTFRGLPHRCELLLEHQGVRYINDSKATNPGATEAALNGLGVGHNLILIAGGEGKGADFAVLRAAVGRHCRQVILIGAAAAQMEACFSGETETVQAQSLEQAVQLAAGVAEPGDCVVLSPACASFDMFSGYAQRGDAFARAVTKIAESAS